MDFDRQNAAEMITRAIDALKAAREEADHGTYDDALFDVSRAIRNLAATVQPGVDATGRAESHRAIMHADAEITNLRTMLRRSNEEK